MKKAGVCRQASRDFPMMPRCFLVGWVLLRARLATESLGVDWVLGICREDESELCLCPPSHAWCTLMEHACVCREAVQARQGGMLSYLCCECARTSVFVLFSMLSDMWWTDSIQIAERARCDDLTSLPAASASVCLGVCVCNARRVKGVDPSYQQHPVMFIFTENPQPQCWCHVTQRYLSCKTHTDTHTQTLTHIHFISLWLS